MRKIPLTQNKFALIDNEDFNLINKSKWWFDGDYATRIIWGKGGKKNTKIYMHSLIIGNKKGLQIDHINRNKLDNRRENLRFVTRSQNLLNASISKANKSGYKGVSWNKEENKWESYIYIMYKKIHLGKFRNIEDAVRARQTYEKRI